MWPKADPQLMSTHPSHAHSSYRTGAPPPPGARGGVRPGDLSGASRGAPRQRHHVGGCFAVEGGSDAGRHAVGGGDQGAVRDMRVSRGHPRNLMPKQAGDGEFGNPSSAAAANEWRRVCTVTSASPARAQRRSSTRGSPTKCPSPRSAENTQSRPFRLGCASRCSTAAAPMGRSCAPLLVSAKRMQRARASKPLPGQR